MSILIGIDVGTKRIGISISDGKKKIAFPLMVIERENNSYGLKKLKDLIKDKDVETFIVGLPYKNDGNLGEQGEKVLQYIENLREYFSIQVIPWDERYTTVIAEKILLNDNIKRVKRKNVIDKIAAQLILQSYLDYINKKNQ